MDLIQITRISQGKIEKTLINFEEIINDTLNSLMNIKGFDEMKFKLNIQKAVVFYSDTKLLLSIFQNLIENVIKYRKEGHKDCYAEINLSNTTNGIMIQITDNGIGIPYEHHQKVFDMFYRATTNSIGTGLGLFIVKTAIEKLGGNIELVSQPKIGSTFTVNLPGI